MKTISINLYKFEELNEEAQQKAIDSNRNINYDYEWWDGTFDDAKEIGLKITGFDLDRNRHATGKLIDGLTEVCRKIITHGKDCETHKTAADFLQQWDALVEKYSNEENREVVSEENEYEFDQEANKLEKKFKIALLEDYSIMLQKEYEYLSEDEAVQKTLITGEYDFTETGKIY